MLALYVVMIVKFFEIARNVATIKDVVRRLEDRIAYGEAPDGSPVEVPAALAAEAETLRELGRLKDEGLLSEEEFRAMKAGLLGVTEP